MDETMLSATFGGSSFYSFTARLLRLPLTRPASPGDLSPQAGRGESRPFYNLARRLAVRIYEPKSVSRTNSRI